MFTLLHPSATLVPLIAFLSRQRRKYSAYSPFDIDIRVQTVWISAENGRSVDALGEMALWSISWALFLFFDKRKANVVPISAWVGLLTAAVNLVASGKSWSNIYTSK